MEAAVGWPRTDLYLGFASNYGWAETNFKVMSVGVHCTPVAGV